MSYMMCVFMVDVCIAGLPAVSTEQYANNATVVIEENGNPSGMIQFTSSAFSVSEEGPNSSSFITIERLQGTLGDVRYISLILNR